MDNPPEKSQDDQLTIPQRWAGLYTAILMVLLLIFFIYHQRVNSGFFTEKFGWVEMVALYGPIIIALVPPIQRLIQGKRNPTRPVEAFTDLSLALGSLWLWNHFPFDFAHLGDIFPPEMRFAFTWINNNVGRFILILQIAIGFLSVLTTIVTYIRERRTRASA